MRVRKQEGDGLLMQAQGAMNKNELEFEKLKIGADKFHKGWDTVAKIVSVGGWVSGVALIMRGLENIVTAKPEAIHALALVVEKLQVNAILGWGVGILSAGAYAYERKGKKRAYKLNSDLRKRLESKDPHCETSGLDDNGHTPK